MQYTTFVLIFSYRSISGVFYLVYFNPCLLMCMSPIVVFLCLSRCFLISFSVRPGHIFRKPCLIALRRIVLVGMKSAACKYLASSGFGICAKMSFTIFSYCCGPRGTSPTPVLLFLVPLIISSTLLCMDVDCLSSVVVHPSSHNNPNHINADVCIFGKMWICIASLLRPGI